MSNFKQSPAHNYNELHVIMSGEGGSNSDQADIAGSQLDSSDSDDCMLLLGRVSSTSKEFRFKLNIIFLVVAVAIPCFILHFIFDYSLAESFFIASNFTTTVGAFSRDIQSASEYIFLSFVIVFMVIPFVIFQMIILSDAISAETHQLNHKLGLRMKRGSKLSVAFAYELKSTLLYTLLVLLSLVACGSIIIMKFTEKDSLVSSIYYSLTIISSIGYDGIGINHEYGYYSLGLYSLLCNYVLSYFVYNRLGSYCSYLITTKHNTNGY